MTNKQSQEDSKILVNFLVHHFLRMQSIVATLASSQLVRIVGNGIFLDVNRFYIQAHEEFFQILEEQKDNKDLEDLSRVVDFYWFSHYRTLEAFSELHELWLLQGHIRDEIEPITGEITRLAVKYNIRSNMHSGINTDSIQVDFQGVVTQQILEEQLTILLAQYNRAATESEKKMISKPESNYYPILDKMNGRVTLYGKVLWTLKFGTLEYRFCAFLFDHIDTVMTHDQIGEYLEIVKYDENTWQYIFVKKIEKTLSAYLQDIKSRMPSAVRVLVSSVVGGYIVDTIEIMREK